MKIVHLIDAISDNGVIRVVQTLAKGMAKDGHQTTLLSCQPIDDKLGLAGLYRTQLTGLSEIKGLRRRLLGSRLAALSSAATDSAALDKWVKSEKPDFVFIHGLCALRFYQAQCNHVIVAHSVKSKMLLPPLGSPMRPILRALYAQVYRSGQLVTVSEGVKHDFIHQFGAKADKIQCIHNPFDINKIRELANLPVDDLPTRPYFVAAGRAVRAKRFDLLIRAFASSKLDADLLILGEGRKFRRYAKLAQDLGVADRLHLPGFRENPFPYFRHARALVLSSDYEGLPSTLIEALICSTPVVSTDCPSGPREILHRDFHHYLVPCGDIKQLADRMRQVFEAPYDYPDMYLEPFSVSKIVNEYIAFAQRAISNS